MIPIASIVIPNWNGRQHLKTCLSALERQTTSNFEVIVVDNSSDDDSTTYIRDHFPRVRVVELEENRGFTGACNAGYEIAQGKYIILLNNDTEVDPAWLGQLLEAFKRHPEAGILASKILLFDRRDHFHAAGDFYRLDAIPGNRGVWQKDSGQYDVEEQVFSACGAAAAYRRELLDEIGFLDDQFYFSCEDIDMGWRAHMAGWKAVYVPTAVVFHKLKATGGSVTGSYFDGRNFLYLIWKNYPWRLLMRYWPAILKSQLQISWQALHAWRGPASRARLRGQFAGLLGLYKMLPARKQIQANRQISDEALASILTPVDDAP